MKSTYLANSILDTVLGSGGTFYLALFTVTPDAEGGGTEVSGGSYARASVANDATMFPSADGGNKANAQTISFPAPSGANWGTVVAWGMFDASSGGNLYYWGPLDSSETINDGDAAPTFEAGSLDFTEE